MRRGEGLVPCKKQSENEDNNAEGEKNDTKSRRRQVRNRAEQKEEQNISVEF